VAGNVLNIGSLINPAYGALNQLTGTNAFPTNVDVRLPLTQETSVRIAQPIFQPAVASAHRIASRLRDAQGAQRDAAERETAMKLRVGYLQLAMARKALEIWDATLVVVTEQVRVTEALAVQGKVAADAVFRARSERSDVEQRRAAAAEDAESARRSLNFLLDRPLESSVAVIADSALGIGEMPSLEVAMSSARAGREELRQLEWSRQAADGARQLAIGNFLPTVSVAVDYGIQGNKYDFRGSNTFTNASVVASWNLFNGTQDAAKLSQASLDERRLAAQSEQAAQGVALEVRQAWAAADLARRAITTAGDRVAAAKKSYELVDKRYAQGMAPMLELLDARNALTSASLNRILTETDYRVRRVQLDRAAALYPRTLP
jgi:outer membrane protein TolC